MEVGASVTRTSLRLVESKTVEGGSYYCKIEVRPLAVPRCDSSTYSSCFELSDTSLELKLSSVYLFQGGASAPRSFTKLSD
jgi:hypothetical protein